MDGITRAIEAAGGLTALADALGVSPQVIHNWRARGVPVVSCIDIEAATKGAVTCEDLRPDLAAQWAVLRGNQKRRGAA